MQTKFKRLQKVKLLLDPDKEYIEYFPGEEGTEIKKGMSGEVNIILPNGKYQVKISEEKTKKTIAYVQMDEDFLEIKK